RKEHTLIVDLHVEVRVAEAAAADRREIGTDAARRPHVVARYQVASGARRLRACEEERAALLRVAGHTRGRRRALDGRLRATVVVRVGAEGAEIRARPAGIAERFARAVGGGADVAARFGKRARGPDWRGGVARRFGSG